MIYQYPLDPETLFIVHAVSTRFIQYILLHIGPNCSIVCVHVYVYAMCSMS